ncbi:MAG: hypothetical protein ACRC1K_21280, partial [Planctomycetia bacterium]
MPPFGLGRDFHVAAAVKPLRLEDPGWIELRLALVNRRAAQHPGGCWDSGDPRSLWFRSFTVEITPPATLASGVVDGLDERSHFFPLPNPAAAIDLVQQASGRPFWFSPNHRRADGAPAAPRAGYVFRQSHPPLQWDGFIAAPHCRATTTDGGNFEIAIPEFAEKFPHGLRVEPGRVKIGLFPVADQPYELLPGERRTVRVLLRWTPTAAPRAAGVLRSFAAPPRLSEADRREILHREPYTSTDESSSELKMYLTEAAGRGSLFHRRDWIDEYGWRNFGDVYADHEAQPLPAGDVLISHYNNQYDLLHGLLRRWLQTDGVDDWTLADPLARHVMDVDLYHTAADKPAYNGGLFWHTAHYRDAGLAGHRCYSAASRRPGEQSFGGGPSSEHNYTNGLLLYHRLTGDQAARDAVLQLADWVAAMDDGRRVWLGVVDDGPTGLASRTRDDDYHGPGRGPANSLRAYVDAWRLTRDDRWLRRADDLVRRVVRPDDDFSALELNDLERRWSYTVCLRVLGWMYDVLRAEQAVESSARRLRHWSAACLEHYAAFLLHESPTLDRRSELEFPTETWAAQDFRKVVVMMQAERFLPVADARALRGRARALYDRAWQDLN